MSGTNSGAEARRNASAFNRQAMRQAFIEVTREAPEASERDRIERAYNRIHERAPVSGAFMFLKGKDIPYTRDTFKKALQGVGFGVDHGKQLEEPLIQPPNRREPQMIAAPPFAAENAILELMGIIEAATKRTDENVGEAIASITAIDGAVVGLQRDVATIGALNAETMRHAKAAYDKAAESKDLLKLLIKALHDGSTGTMRNALSRIVGKTGE